MHFEPALAMNSHLGSLGSSTAAAGATPSAIVDPTVAVNAPTSHARDLDIATSCLPRFELEEAFTRIRPRIIHGRRAGGWMAGVATGALRPEAARAAPRT